MLIWSIVSRVTDWVCCSAHLWSICCYNDIRDAMINCPICSGYRNEIHQSKLVILARDSSHCSMEIAVGTAQCEILITFNGACRGPNSTTGNVETKVNDVIPWMIIALCSRKCWHAANIHVYVYFLPFLVISVTGMVRELSKKTKNSKFDWPKDRFSWMNDKL